MMRIGLDAKRAFNNQAGLGNYSRFVIKNLARYANEHQYLCYTPKADPDLLFFAVSSSLKTRYPSSWFNKKFKSIWRSKNIVKDLKRDQIDIYHGLSNEIPLHIQQSGIKSIVTIHDLIFLRYPHYYKRIDRNIYHKKFRYACENADHIIAISEQTKSDIISYYNIDKDKISVIYQDCSSDYYCDCIGEDNVLFSRKKYGLPIKYALSVGTLESRKNQLLILKALKELNDQEIPLVLVGRATPYLKELEAYIKTHQLEKSVLILTNVQHTHIASIFLGAHLFIYPSRFEGFGIPILEALNSGVPVITGKGSCFEETGGHAAKYIDQDDALNLAKEIKTCWYNQEERDRMIEEGKKHALTFRAEQTIPQLINVYKKVLENSSSNT